MAKLSKILVISALSIITMSTTAFAQTPKDTDSGLLMLVNAEYRIPDGFDPDKVMFEDLSLIHILSDRVAFFADGNIVESGTPEDIFVNTREARTKDFLKHMLAR